MTSLLDESQTPLAKYAGDACPDIGDLGIRSFRVEKPADAASGELDADGALRKFDCSALFECGSGRPYSNTIGSGQFALAFPPNKLIFLKPSGQAVIVGERQAPGAAFIVASLRCYLPK